MTQKSPEQKLEAILSFVIEVGTIDGAHHKQWALDQILCITLGIDEYTKFIKTNPDWDTGIAP